MPVFLPLPPEGGTSNGAVSSCTPIAAGADNDVERDGGPVKDGDMDSRGQSAFPPEVMNLCQYSESVYVSPMENRRE